MQYFVKWHVFCKFSDLIYQLFMRCILFLPKGVVLRPFSKITRGEPLRAVLISWFFVQVKLCFRTLMTVQSYHKIGWSKRRIPRGPMIVSRHAVKVIFISFWSRLQHHVTLGDHHQSVKNRFQKLIIGRDPCMGECLSWLPGPSPSCF